MQLPLDFLIDACIVSFLFTGALFLWTGVQRHRLDDRLTRGKSLGLFATWSPGKSLAVPERRWTYDHDYMVAFIKAMCGLDRSEFALSNEHRFIFLNLYDGPTLGRDQLFAVAFAVFIVSMSLFLGQWFGEWPWSERLALIGAAMGIVYGAADIAEDLKLRRIFSTARKALPKGVYDGKPETDASMADAAQVDAANALTRIKLVTIGLSGVGLVAFCVLLVLDAVVTTTLRGPTLPTTPGDAGPLRPATN